MKNDKLFYQCFSGKQKKFLEDKGNKMILKCKHFETDNTMWIFMFDKNNKLANSLAEWSQMKEISEI